MKLRLIYPIFLLLFLQNLAQARSDLMRWGDVPQSDLLMRQLDTDTSADAYILGDLGKMNVYYDENGYEYSLVRHKRIKIFNKNGFDQADITIPFYSKDKIEQIQKVSAQIIMPSGKVYELKKKAFFEEKVNEYYSVIRFTFPNVEEGAVIEYRYRMVSKNVTQLDTWYFHNSLPTRVSELKLNVSARFSYITLFEGAEEMTKTGRNGTTILTSGDTEMRIRPGYYVMLNAPALKEEAYITTIDDYRARIRFQLKEVMYMDGTKQSFLSTWEEVAKELMIDQEFGGQITRKRNYKKMLEALESELKIGITEPELIDQVYQFLASRMEWNGRYGIYASSSLDEIFERKSASAVELNLMFLALLNHFDIRALPVLTSTRSHGKVILDYPIMEQFNHVMVLLPNEKGGRLVDIPSRIRPLGLPNVNSLNYFGWLVRQDKPEWISINAPLGTDAFHTKIDLVEGGVNCRLSARFTNYNAIVERESYYADPAGSYWKNRFSERMPEVKIDSFSVKNALEVAKPFVNDLTFSAEEVAFRNEDFIYLSPILYSNFSENPFKQDARYYPVDFPYPFAELYTTTIIIPEGYVVEELPEDVSFPLGGDRGSFKYEIQQKDGMLMLKSQIKIEKLKFQPKHYPRLKKMFEIMLSKHNEQIVLRKEN